MRKRKQNEISDLWTEIKDKKPVAKSLKSHGKDQVYDDMEIDRTTGDGNPSQGFAPSAS